VFLLDVLGAALDDHHRDLRRSSIVEIDERLTIHGLAQNRKVLANALNIPAFARLGLDGINCSIVVAISSSRSLFAGLIAGLRLGL